MSNTTQPTIESQTFDPDAPVVMPTPQSQQRLALYMHAAAAAAAAAKIPVDEFRGLVLLSLLVHGTDEMWEESIAEALETLMGGEA